MMYYLCHQNCNINHVCKRPTSTSVFFFFFRNIHDSTILSLYNQQTNWEGDIVIKYIEIYLEIPERHFYVIDSLFYL